MQHKNNEELIDELKKLGYLTTPELIRAFLKVDRKFFVPSKESKYAYANEPLPIGHNQTISQPLVAAFMLELLQIQPADKILEIGTGSGWQTTLIATLLKKDENKQSPRLISIEIIEELSKTAQEKINTFEQKELIQCEIGDGSRGDLQQAPFDKIIAWAAGKEIPIAWKEQLRIGGRIVAPIKNSIIVLDKKDKKEFETKEYFGFSFVPLVGKE